MLQSIISRRCIKMRANDIKSISKLIIPILKRNDIVKAGIFGSFARGEAKKSSDVDILIKFKKEKSLLDVVRIERELSEKLGRKVDLVNYGIIHPKLKKQILQEEVSVI